MIDGKRKESQVLYCEQRLVYNTTNIGRYVAQGILAV